MTQFGYAPISTSPAMRRINERAEAIWQQVTEARAQLSAVTDQLAEKQAQLLAMDQELHAKLVELRHIEPAVSRAYRVRQIKRETAIEFGLPEEVLVSDRRSREYVLARARAAQRLNDEVGLSSPHVGRILGKRDHTTILHALKPEMRARVKEWLEARRPA